jgi:hypothetical protein
MAAQSEAHQHANKVGDQNVKDLASKDVKYVQSLKPSDADYMGTTSS